MNSFEIAILDLASYSASKHLGIIPAIHYGDAEELAGECGGIPMAEVEAIMKKYGIYFID